MASYRYFRVPKPFSDIEFGLYWSKRFEIHVADIFTPIFGTIMEIEVKLNWVA